MPSPTVQNATPHREGLSDTLLYQTLVGDGVVRLKDGALLGGFWFDGIDLESAATADVVTLVRGFTQAVRPLDSGWMLHQETIRRRCSDYLDGTFQSPVDAYIDSERGRACRYFRTDSALFVTYLPSFRDQSTWIRRLEALLLGEKQREVTQAFAEQQQMFESKLFELEEALRRAGLVVKRMRSLGAKGDDLLKALNYCVNGAWHPVLAPADGDHLDVLLGDDLVNGVAGLRYGDRFVKVVSPMEIQHGEGGPAGRKTTRMAMLTKLARLDVEFRWSTRFIFRGHLENTLMLRSRMNKVRQKAGLSRHGDQHSQDQIAELMEAKRELEAGIGYGRLTNAVVVMADTESEAAEQARRVVKTFQECGFVAKVERTNALSALLGSFPGHGYWNVRKLPMSTLNLTHLISLSREWEGEPFCPCPPPFFPRYSPPLLQARAASGSKFFLNLHAGDLGHSLVIGPPGSGKSTLLAALATQFGRYPGAQVIAFDNGNSIRTLAYAQPDGVHYELGAKGSIALCPLAHLNRGRHECDEDEIAWAIEWVEGLFQERGLTLTPLQQRAVKGAVTSLADSTDRPNERTLRALATALQDEELKRAMEYYSHGLGARVLGGDSDALEYRRFTVFEIGELLRMSPSIYGPTLRYLFRRVERTRVGRRPTLLLADEAWKALATPVFAEKFREWALTMRKANCAVVLGTQSPRHIAESEIGQGLLESFPTRIFAPSPTATTEGLAEVLKKHFGLHEGQVQLIANARPKSDYLYQCGGHTRLFSLDLPGEVLPFLGVSSPKDLDQVAKLQAEWGLEWPVEWLKANGFAEAASRYAAIAEQRAQQAAEAAQ